ncbi:prephenate dehydrogenase [Candidatus Oleimmundimicrobium sp.]|uniref:prephenate dehydrogenase n=1 Tax=Candidatus Oleimmundimicrobium sp. TaxID=3060597 RepID=UPI00271D3F6D|nr:prephenate dehydrogenase [Candidatus Oleimmundimicrobium sp.]MDO8885299.1 prephenate dehydrogenase [Candidatus Oleimmundimicrobium sp.]
MSDFKQVSIIGVGLIGGSLGLAIKNLPNSPKVVGVTRRQDTIDKAKKIGAIDEGTLSMEEGVKGSDIIFVATPVGVVVDIVKKILPFLNENCIVTDVGSTKFNICHSVEEFLPSKIHFIGGHPMTGSEHEGISAADSNLFKNAYYILTPTSATDMRAFKQLHLLLTKIGANVIAIDPDKHDELVAVVSHLPHLLSATLVNLAHSYTSEKENLLLLAAGGFRDMTRIAAGNPSMWLDICFENRDAILKEICEFQKELDELKEIIKEKDRDGLEAKLESASIVRKNLPLILHKDISQFREISISVKDRPGAISDVTVALGNIGINIEGIEIVHLTESSGLIKLVITDSQAAERAAKTLKDKGYKVEIKDVYEKE